MQDVDLIIFDLGRVLVDFDFRKVIRDLGRHSSFSEKQILRYFQRTPLWDKFERGHVAPDLFFKTLQKDLKLKGLNLNTFTPIWNSIFREKTDTVEVVRQLRRRYRIAMLSNVNVMHWEYILGRHAFMEWFDHPVASYAVGYRKPDFEAFRVVLRKANVSPQKAIFFDDVIEHIHAARQLGIRAFQFIDARQLISDLGDIR